MSNNHNLRKPDMLQCTAAVAREAKAPFAIETITIEDPRPDEVIIRIKGTGVCHTDIVVRDQYYPTPLPAVLGHEGAGVVERVGSAVTKVQPGDHVVMAFGSCGKCANCEAGKAPYCLEFFGYNFGGGRADGSSPLTGKTGERISGCFFCQSSFGDFALAKARNVVKIDKSVPLELMGPLGCGISTGAGTVINALRPHAGSSIAVFGAGSVGMAAIMAARIVGCTTIIAVDLNDSRLKLALALGATHMVNGGREDAVAAVQALTGGLGAHYSVECTGVPKVFRQAVEALRVTGTCGLIGAAPLGTDVAFDMNNILFGRTIKGVVEGDSNADIFIPQLIELWKQGRFPFDKLIKFYDLKDINLACAASEDGSVLKPVLRP
ncbi:MAG: NAD(P)-dependent alcohol dehydrogenase [Acidocella sp.]|nr:NAD(P)-dependent alcohol dehydrogenase [Acidocella sp.]